MNEKPETLGQKQERFASMVPGLINKAIALGYTVRAGDLFRAPEVFGKMGESKGYGHPNSCHKLKLAIDLNLLFAGFLIKTDKGHKELHDWWDTQGGSKRISNDMNHYSLEHEGFR